ncbi:efflux RND transporter periplasmic adaptor subunit [Olivibacter sp. CPCC 100613]|uniref:efflux RND transporter periplasmic adaptor subunit n=1 Tax=Olivibacter sp. CPCC 100613 TaxID=3079931 RepID=UPI002FFA1525
MKYIIYSWIAFLFLAACSGENKEQEKADKTADSIQQLNDTLVNLSDEQISSAGIEVGKPLSEHISGMVALQGAVDVPPKNTVNLSFPMSGYVKSTSMLPGKQVKKGEVLAVLADMQFIQLQQDYLTAKTNAALAEAEFDRQRELNASKASSDKVFQQAKAEMERQRILVSAFGEKLALIGIDQHKLNASNVRKEVSLISPINGFVAKVNVAVGKYTSPTDVLFELIDPSDIHLSLKVFEKDLPNIVIGERVSAYTNNNPAKKFGAKVFLVSRTFDENRMADIHCHFDQYDPSLVPGMFMNAEVAVKDVKALVVPEEAIVRWENKYYVFIERSQGNFIMTEITPGIQRDGKQQIEGNAINIDTKLVVKNAFSLLMKIKNTEEEG